jgi:Xaa-Pro aminopeptidase
LSIFRDRRRKLLRAANGNKIVAATPANVFWLTDFWGEGTAIVHDDRTMIFTSPLEVDRAEKLGNEVEVVMAKSWAEVPVAVMKSLGNGRMIVDDDIAFAGRKGVQRRPEVFLEARSVKDEVEVERIKRASAAQDRIFRAFEKEIRPGRTEREIASEAMKIAISSGLTTSGSDSALSPIIVASGPNGALPHGELSGRRVKRGDLVVADIFFRYEGYNSDETRTFSVGSPTAEMKRNYAAVLDAQEQVLAAMKAGARCRGVHEAALTTLREHGVGRYLIHGIGHGVGIDIHESPTINRVSTDRLSRGQVVTDEPGVYFPGRYGIRIEDTVLIRRRPEPLTHYTKELVEVG